MDTAARQSNLILSKFLSAPRTRRGLAAVAAACGLAQAASFSQATSFTFSGPTGGSWSVQTNWTPNGTPGASDIANFGDTLTSRTAIYDPAAPANIGSVFVNQSTGGISNILQLVQQPTSFTLIDIFQTTTALNTNATLQLSGITLNVGSPSVLQFGTFSTTSASGNVVTATGGGSININGGELLAISNNSANGANYTDTAPVNMSSGSIDIVSAASKTTRLIINGNFTATGGMLTDNTNVASNILPTFFLGGSVVSIGSGVTGSLGALIGISSGGNQAITMGTGAFGLLLRNSTTSAGTTAIKTLTSTATNNAIGTLQFQNGTPSSGIDTLNIVLGSNLTQTAGEPLPTFASAGTLSVTNMDLAGFTFDGTQGSTGFVPALGSSTALSPFNINSSTGTGLFKASLFNFATSDTSIGSNVTLQATGTGTNSLGLLTNGTATISSTATFLYTGVGSGSLTANRAIGALTVGDGVNGSTLNIVGSLTTTGNVVVNNTGTLILTNVLTPQPNSISVASSGTLAANITQGLVNGLAAPLPSVLYATGAPAGTVDLSSVGSFIIGAFNTGGNSLSSITSFTPYANTFRFGTPGGGTLTLAGISLGGAGNSLVVSGPVLFGSSNASYGGSTTINSGAVLRATTSTRIPATTALTILGTGSLDLANSDTNGYVQSVASLAGSGIVTIGTNGASIGRTLNVNGSTDTTFNGTILDGTGTGSAPVSFSKNGASRLTFTGTNTYTGPTAVNGGNLFVTGAITSSSITVGTATGTGGTLSGTGIASGPALTINTGGTVAAGDASGNGTLSTNSFSLNSGATDLVNLNGTAAGQYSNLTLLSGSGTITLGGNLTVNVNYTPAVGDHFIIIRNTPGAQVNGTFSNVDANSDIVATNGDVLAVNTMDDGSNDVTLTIQSVPEPASLAVLSIGALLLNRRRRRSS